MKRAIVMILLGLAANAVAQQVRVMVQVIEVPHVALTKWTSAEKLNGYALHDRAMKLTETGEAEVMETIVLLAQNGQKAVAESHPERIAPTIFNRAEPQVTPGPESKERHVWRAYDAVFHDAFETRNAGPSLEIEPTIAIGGQFVDLRYAFEIVDRIGLETWTEFRDQWGDASVRTPIYTTRRITSAMTLRPGSFELCTVLTPKPAEVPAATTRQLVFVRCDLLKSGTENEDE